MGSCGVEGIGDGPNTRCPKLFVPVLFVHRIPNKGHEVTNVLVETRLGPFTFSGFVKIKFGDCLHLRAHEHTFTISH